MTPEVQQWLIYAAILVIGYLLKQWGINLPILPAPKPIEPQQHDTNARLLELAHKLVDERREVKPVEEVSP